MNESDRTGKEHADRLASLSDAQRKEVLNESRIAIRRAQIAVRFERRFGVKPTENHVCNDDLLEQLKALPPGCRITGVYLKKKD